MAIQQTDQDESVGTTAGFTDQSLTEQVGDEQVVQAPGEEEVLPSLKRTTEEPLAPVAAPIAAAPAPAPAPGPELGPVPQVPPPPVTFNLGGQGGGAGASTFARPGSAGAKPFRSGGFAQSRVGRGATEGPERFGAGSAIAGGGAPVSFSDDAGGAADDPQNDDELARILATVAGRYQGGGQ